ncbi:MAG: hypothetical protein UV02_C0052G0005 [Candidatus Kuenenbacteria bacterium GW2011_GWA2_42_15]|uniref:Uncharacterized protein n=1 Tax=Candidatus Kuenenbacteria bacterium GW2011_GWA2_42_15 TaxID=1618677 RepID=A0A0G0YTE8_9BACT|nr:MAG: hypothetical protein UV02_C0052G0005 [Candidatus Kuenenbacteria bacterium GW2011_GWA2_42_15]
MLIKTSASRLISSMAGIFFSLVTPLLMSAAHSKATAEFLAVLTVISPLIFFPPLITNFAIIKN